MTVLAVGSVVIDWIDQTLEVTDTTGRKHKITLDQTIRATMIGHPEQVQETMQAHELASYIERAYIILQIEYEEGPGHE